MPNIVNRPKTCWRFVTADKDPMISESLAGTYSGNIFRTKSLPYFAFSTLNVLQRLRLYGYGWHAA